MTTGVSVRVLASPGFALALVVLILNDHVLKQAWPSLVTGKLSDVAGLVVAPLLLAVLLSLARMPRALPVAIALTGVGFSVVKTSATGAAVASDVWSLTGIPTQMRADVTDLLALPALYGAWLVQRRTNARAPSDWRSTMAATIGTAMLPVAVVATAATSCQSDRGVSIAGVVEGTFAGPPRGIEQLVVVGSSEEYSRQAIDAAGQVRSLTAADEARLPDFFSSMERSACDEAGRCWRVGVDEPPRIEVSNDGGTSWRTAFEMSESEVDAALAGIEPGCGERASARALTLAVFDESDAAHVVVPVRNAGLLVGSADGSWVRISREQLGDAPAAPEPSPTPSGQLRLPQPSRPPAELESTTPGVPTCASPTTVSVTPDPQNGPPTSYTLCR